MSHQTFKMSLGFIAVVALVLAAALPAQAAMYYWDIDGANPGAGGGATPSADWPTSGTTWSTSSAGDVAISAYTTTGSDDLYFSAGTTATGAYTVNLTGDNKFAKSMTFEDGSATITGAYWMLSGTGATINTTASAGTTTFNSSFWNDTFPVTKTGPGTLIMNIPTANYSTLNINEGTVRLGATNGVKNNLTVNSGGTFDLGGYSPTLSYLTLAGGSIALGGGTLNINFTQTNVTGTGSLVSGSGQWAFSSGNGINLASGSELTITSLLNIATGGDSSITGPATGTGTVILANPTPNANLIGNNFRLETNATLKLGANEQFPDTMTWYVFSYNDVTRPSTFDLNGFNETFARFGSDYCRSGKVKVNGGTLTLTSASPWGPNGWGPDGLRMEFSNSGTLKYNNSGNWTMSMSIDVGSGGGKIDTSPGNGYTEITAKVTGSGALTVKTGSQKMYFNPATYSGFDGSVIADAGAGGVEVAGKTYNATTTFGATGGGTMKLNSGGSCGYITAAGATVDRPSGTWTLTGSGTVITASGTNTFTNGNSLVWTGDKTINVTSGVTTSAWYLSGGSGMHITFTGGGTFTNTNVWSLGNMTVDGGNYNYQSTSSNNQTITTLTVKNGGTWTSGGTNSDINTTNAPILNGGTISGTHKLSIQGDNNTDMVVSDGTSTISANMWLQNKTRNIVVNSGMLTISGNIENDTSITKKGTGGMIISGIVTSWTNGSLLASAGKTFINSTLFPRDVTVSNLATLGGTGTIGGAVSLASGGHIAPGASVGNLTLNKPLDLSGGGILDIEVSGATADQLIITNVGGSGNLILGGSSSLNMIELLPGTFVSIPIVTYAGTLTGVFGSNNLPAAYSLQYNAGVGGKQILLLPEPATMALLGLGAFGLFFGRRRSRKS
jgi:hypothetical protein